MSIINQSDRNPSGQNQFDRTIHPVGESIVVKADASAQLTTTDCTVARCKRCAELELKVEELEKKLKRLTEAQPAAVHQSPIGKSTPNQKNQQQSSSSNSKISPIRLRYSFDKNDAVFQSQEKLLQEIEQKAEKLCRKERKQREIIKKMIQNSQNEARKPIANNETHETLSKSEISPIKPDPIKQLKLPRTNSLIIEPFSPIKEETETQRDLQNILGGEKKEEPKVLDIPSSFLIEDIPKRENARPSMLQAPILDNNILDSFLKEDEEKIKANNQQGNDTLSLSRQSQSRVSTRSQKETEDAYKNQMRNSKLMAKLKKKK